MEEALVRQGLSARALALTRRRAIAACAALAGCAQPPAAPDDDDAPALAREFRAAWVASVAHIDWPSRAGLCTRAQRAEMHALLDRALAVGLNAVVLQVRPSADALYPSAIEPWSEVLTGASGRPPDEPWDPLAEWVHEAHRRGIELHAWFNPFRARHPSAASPPAPNHIVSAAPQLVRAYGDLLWLDPGEPAARQRFVDVVLDVLARYDVDGVHIDDYFYPYPALDAAGRELPFPDDAPYARYREGGGTLERADWRRANVDDLVATLQREVRGARPWVRLGISPFGLPRPDLRPPGIEGFSQHDKLYADVERWLHEGWLDYLAPQLYWPIAAAAQSFPVLLEHWQAHNRQRRHVWPGLFTSRIGMPAERAYTASEVLAQIDVARRRGSGGHLHFSMAALLGNREGIADMLRAGPYAQPALPPPTPWLAEAAPLPPRSLVRWRAGGGFELQLHDAGGPPLRQAAVWQRRGAAWSCTVVPLPAARGVPIDDASERIVVEGYGRTGLASARVRFARSWGLWARHGD